MFTELNSLVELNSSFPSREAFQQIPIDQSDNTLVVGVLRGAYQYGI
jgi:hypothetical protein